MHAFLQCTQRGRAVFHMTAASLIGNEFALTIDCLNLFKQDARKIGKKKNQLRFLSETNRYLHEMLCKWIQTEEKRKELEREYNGNANFN